MCIEGDKKIKMAKLKIVGELVFEAELQDYPECETDEDMAKYEMECLTTMPEAGDTFLEKAKFTIEVLKEE